MSSNEMVKHSNSSNSNIVRNNAHHNSNELGNAFHDWFGGWPVVPFFANSDALMNRPEALDGFKKCKDGTYVLHVEVPGMKSKDLDVEFEDGGVSIKGSTSTEKDDESYSNSVEEFYTLPEDADPAKVKAKLTDGVLTLKFAPKAAADKAAKKIAIE